MAYEVADLMERNEQRIADREVPQAWEPPEVFTAATLCARPDPPQEELLSPVRGSKWGPLLVKGSRLVIGGYTGEGKTTLAIEIVKAVSSASQFLEWKGAGERCLVIDLEQGERSAKRKLRQSGLGDSQRVDYVLIPDGMDLGDYEHAQWIEGVIEEGEYGLVVVDPLYKMHRGDAKEERTMTDLMRRVDGLRARHNFALVIPMHLRKRSNDPKAPTDIGIGEIQGSGSLTWGAEVVVALRRQKSVDPVTGDHRNSFYWLKDRDGELPPTHTEWILTWTKSGGFKRVADARDTTVEAQLRNYLIGRPNTWIPKRELEAELFASKGPKRGEKGVSARTVEKAITKLRDDALADGLGDPIRERTEKRGKEYLVINANVFAPGQPAVPTEDEPTPEIASFEEGF